MPAQAAITLNSKTYAPRGTSNGISTWVLPSGDATFGGAQSELTESVRGPLASGNTRTRWVLSIPKVATTDSACSCTGATLGKGKADIVIDIPTSFTSAERQDFADRIQALVALAVFDASVSGPEGSWS